MHPQVDAYLEALPEPAREAGLLLRTWILDLIPGVEERFSFRIPFYHYFGMLLYINQKGQGIDIGFCRGKDLLLSYPELQMTNRVMVASLFVENKADLFRLPVRELITTAAAWNEEAFRQKRPMINKSNQKRR
jgi:hypothetical protein